MSDESISSKVDISWGFELIIIDTPNTLYSSVYESERTEEALLKFQRFLINMILDEGSYHLAIDNASYGSGENDREETFVVLKNLVLFVSYINSKID